MWGQTLAQSDSEPVANPQQPGCLLQIYPLDVNRQLTDLPASLTTIGRDESCHLILPDASVSRCHATIQRTAEGYRIEDRGSTNGTFVNESRVTSHLLQPGDRVQVGSFIFKFLCNNHIELQYHEAVYTMMTRDGLTGTLNKRSFMELLTREFQRALHRDSPLCLIMFDLDHFKGVNDNYGHLAGDEVLQEVSKRVTDVIAEHDVFARYGGEEFAILLPAVSLAEAVRVAERCRLAVAADPCATSAGPLPITISVGVADFAGLDDPRGAAALVQAADVQLYAAKRHGRNRVHH
jgi:diguanylate cyclase (GGDEF)-like protein